MNPYPFICQWTLNYCHERKHNPNSQPCYGLYQEEATRNG